MESDIPLELNAVGDSEIRVSVHRPKRVLHFSDGTLEEFSDDENDEVDSKPEEIKVDESKMTWGPWIAYKSMRAGTVILSGCDYVGETLASLFGITTPKYQYEIDQYNKMHKEMEKEKDEEEAQTAGWKESITSSSNNNNETTIISQEKF